MTDDGEVEILELELKEVDDTFVFKPQVGVFCIHTLRTSKPQVVIADFKNHSMNSGYNEFSLDGEAIEAWAEAS